MNLLEVKNLKKVYGNKKGEAQTEALKSINLSIREGEFIAIMGESGSGKTTLLNILATLDSPTLGEVILEGQNLQKLSDENLTTFRREKLGFVFQDFNLLDTFTNRDNIFLPLVLSGMKPKEMEKRIRPLAERLGISDLLDKYPYEISGGQKQRVAIARAIITEPRLILADEPTGALDSKSADNIMEIFSDFHEQGQTILMVTHSSKAAAYAKRVLFIKDGTVFHELYRGDMDYFTFLDKIVQAQQVLLNRGVTYVQ